MGRDINRHYYTVDEIDEALARPVVRALMALCRLRSTLPAFDGALEVELDGTTLTMRRRGVADPTCVVEAAITLADGSARLSWQSREGAWRVDDLLKVGGA